MMSINPSRAAYDENLKQKCPGFDPIDRDELLKIDRKASTRQVGRKLAFLYAEGMAKAVDTYLKAIDEMRDGLMESLPEWTDRSTVEHEITKNAKAASDETMLKTIYSTAKTPQFYNGMKVTVAMAARQLGGEDIDPCRINSKDLKDATVYFSKLVLGYGLSKFDERKIRRAVRGVKRQADAASYAGYS